MTKEFKLEDYGLNPYERALMRWYFVWDSIKDRDWNAVVPSAFLESGDPQRKVKNDWSHALVNIPVEFARWRWGWSQTKTKWLMPYVLIRMALS